MSIYATDKQITFDAVRALWPNEKQSRRQRLRDICNGSGLVRTTL
jgi:hypothetical protein